MNFTHCSECGSAYSELSSPRTCECGHIKWFNPVPVVAVVQPVLCRNYDTGIVVAKRAIEPCKGQWALIGGFMECDETVEEAAAREFREETGLELAAPPKIMFTLPVGGRVRRQLMIMTYVDVPLRLEVFETGKPCAENEELGLMYAHGDTQLAFPSHRDAVKRYFGDKR